MQHLLRPNRPYWNWGAYWDEGAYAIGALIRIRGGALIREGALIGTRALNGIITVCAVTKVGTFLNGTRVTPGYAITMAQNTR